jgi:glutamate-1-semialdehyde aminotransferase
LHAKPCVDGGSPGNTIKQLDSIANLAQRMQGFVSKITQTAEVQIFLPGIGNSFHFFFISKKPRINTVYMSGIPRQGQVHSAESDHLLQESLYRLLQAGLAQQ